MQSLIPNTVPQGSHTSHLEGDFVPGGPQQQLRDPLAPTHWTGKPPPTADLPDTLEIEQPANGNTTSNTATC